MKILIAEDNIVLASQIQKMLVKQKFSVDVVPDGRIAEDYLDTMNYDLLLLDIGLPKIDGITLCEKLRSQGKAIPILMLTGHNKIQDKLRGLNAGGDDYLTKPFDSEELIARVHSLLRRRQIEVQPILSWGNLSFNQNLNQIYYENVPLNLTVTEHQILALLLLNPKQVFSRQALIDRIWPSTREIPSDDAIKSHVKTIRRKLQNFQLGRLIKTIYGVGYCLDTEFRDALVKLSSSLLKVDTSCQTEKTFFKKSVVIYSENCSWDDKFISSLKLKQLTSDLLPGIYFDVDTVRISNVSSLRNHFNAHTPDLLLILLDSTDTYQKMFEILKEIQSKITIMHWFFITKNQAFSITNPLDEHSNCCIEKNQLSLRECLQNISYFLASSHAKSARKTRIFVFSDCHLVLDTLKLLSEENNYMVTVINTFEEIWNIQNIALPTVLIIDAKFEHSTGLDLCYLLRNNLYFNHIPIAMIGNSHPYVLDAIIQAGIDYFIDRNKLTSQLLSFSDWLNRKSYQCRS